MSHASPPTRRKRAPRSIEADTRLHDWGPRGSVLAEVEGRTVQVQRGIPGERDTVTLQLGRKPLRGIVTNVLDPSPHRVIAPCPAYLGGCGGCQWQHMLYSTQVEAKRTLVERALRDAGTDVKVGDVFAMATPWRYRHTAALALGWEAGFRPLGRRGIVEITDCPISHPLVGELAAQLNGILARQELPNYHGKVWLDCTVVGSRAHPSLQVLIQGIAGLTLETHPELPRIASVLAALSPVSSVAFRHRSGEPIALIGDLMSPIELLGRSMWLPAGSFFQTNLDMIEALLLHMRARLSSLHVRSVADIYGGTGTFALHLASSVDRMVLIELDSLAVEAARRTAADWGIGNLATTSAHAERALPHLPPLDLAIVDPPRSGLGEGVVRSLAANGVPNLFYVSCNPSSLARDGAALQALGYTWEYLGMYDFYPQTYHVESFAVFSR